MIKNDEYDLYNSYYIIFNNIILLPIIFKGYNILVDQNYTASVIFHGHIHYIKNANMINYLKDLKSCYIDYPKDVYI
jgi:hypothetical protein